MRRERLSATTCDGSRMRSRRIPSSRGATPWSAKSDAEPARRHVRSSDIIERLSLFLGSLSPRTLAWSASAAALVVLLQIGVISGVLFNQRAGYETASAPSTTAEGVFAIVRFAPDASAAGITQLLEANKISIAEGPLPGGLYRLRAAGVQKENLPTLIEQLKQDKSVSFVAPTE